MGSYFSTEKWVSIEKLRNYNTVIKKNGDFVDLKIYDAILLATPLKIRGKQIDGFISTNLPNYGVLINTSSYTLGNDGELEMQKHIYDILISLYNRLSYKERKMCT